MFFTCLCQDRKCSCRSSFSVRASRNSSNLDRVPVPAAYGTAWCVVLSDELMIGFRMICIPYVRRFPVCCGRLRSSFVIGMSQVLETRRPQARRGPVLNVTVRMCYVLRCLGAVGLRCRSMLVSVMGYLCFVIRPRRVCQRVPRRLLFELMRKMESDFARNNPE